MKQVNYFTLLLLVLFEKVQCACTLMDWWFICTAVRRVDTRRTEEAGNGSF